MYEYWVIEKYWNLNWWNFLRQWDDNWLCCMHMKVTNLISSFQDHLSSSSLILHFLIQSIITLMYSDFLVRKLTNNYYVIEGHKKAEGHFFFRIEKIVVMIRSNLFWGHMSSPKSHVICMIRPRILRIFNFLEFVTFEELVLLFVEKGLMRSNSGKNQGFQLKFADFSKVDEE